MKYLLILLLLLTGCGSGGDTTQTPPDVPVDPVPISSAQITAFKAQYMWHDYLNMYFSTSGSIFNNGETDLTDIYLQISGEDYYWDWANLKVSMPFNLPRGTNYSFTDNIVNSTHEVIMVTGVNPPANYILKVEIRTTSGEVLDTKYVMVRVI